MSSEPLLDLFTPEWPLPEGVQARFTGRRGGTSSAPYDSFNLSDYVGDDPQAVATNRAALLAALPGCEGVQFLTQVHGCDLIATGVSTEGVNGKPEADASSTTDRGIACAVTTADCLPVMFCDDAGERIAAAHAGWRGLAAGILLRTLRAFPDPQRVSAYLAPAIGPKAFEVGPEVRDAFAGAPDTYFTSGEGDRLFADLAGIARWQLRNAGIGSVFGGGQCTFSDSERFFSYRRDGRTGRQLSLIWKTR